MTLHPAWVVWCFGKRNSFACRITAPSGSTHGNTLLSERTSQMNKRATVDDESRLWLFTTERASFTFGDHAMQYAHFDTSSSHYKTNIISPYSKI